MSRIDAAPAARRPQARLPSVPRSRWSRPEALGEGVAAGERSIRARDLAAAGATELLSKDVGVSLGGSRRDAETTRHLIVRASSGDQLDHLKLPIRDHRRPLVHDCDHDGEANNGPRPRLLTRRRNFGWYSLRSSFLLAGPLARDALADRRDEARLVTAAVGFRQLVLVQRRDAAQEIELVAEVRPHHLGAIGRDGERHAVVDERAEGLAHRFLARKGPREQV